MRGEDLFRFEDAKREFGFHAATPDNLAALTTAVSYTHLTLPTNREV